MSDKIVTSSIDEKEKKRRGEGGGRERKSEKSRRACLVDVREKEKKKPVTLFSVPRGLIAKLIEIA